jgi:hypothetical protein
MADIFCQNCGNPLPSNGRFCPACGRDASSPAAPAAALPAPAAAKPRFSLAMACGYLLLAVFVIGVAGQFGYDQWRQHQKKAFENAFYSLARPLVGSWQVVEGKDIPAGTAYAAKLQANTSAYLTGEPPEELLIQTSDPKMPNWTFSTHENGRLKGGGMEPSDSDFSIGLGTAEPSPDSRRLTVRMRWNGSRDTVAVLEQIGKR